jgi:hypothetical protein
MAKAVPVEEGGNWHQGPARKADEHKIRMDLLPPGPQVDTAEVFTFGAVKYDDRNWEKGFNYSRVYGALQRHLFAWWSGEDLDSEWSLSHLAHARCCLDMLLEFHLHSHAGIDDRPGHQPLVTVNVHMDEKDIERLSAELEGRIQRAQADVALEKGLRDATIPMPADIYYGVPGQANFNREAYDAAIDAQVRVEKQMGEVGFQHALIRLGWRPPEKIKEWRR